MTTSEQRKYQPLWEQIKQHKQITVQLQPLEITDEQAGKQFKTFRKAISKEKWLDSHYRAAHPNSRVQYYLDIKLKQVTFTLEDDTSIDLGVL